MPSKSGKLAQIRSFTEQGDWAAALRLAAAFPRLGAHRVQITRAWSAIQNPDFYRQLKKDPDILVAEGIAALKDKYGL